MKLRTAATIATSAAAAAAGFLLTRRVHARSFASALIDAAARDIDVTEDIAKNDGRRIREYFAGSRVDPPANWCAAAVTFWVRAAARALSVPMPIAGSLQAKVLGEQLAELAARGRGAWHTAEELRRNPALLKVGDIVVWDRSDPARPETSWFGHVGLVVEIAGETFGTIEGNSGPHGDRVARMKRTLADPRLIGAGRAW